MSIARTRKRLLALAVLAVAVIGISAVTARTTSLAAADVTIFGDAIAPGWVDWSWNSSLSVSTFPPAAGGARSLVWSITAPWGGLYLHTNSPLNSSGYQSLSFALRAVRAGQSVAAMLEDPNNVPLGSFVNIAPYGGAPVAGSWTWYTVPISALAGRDASIGGVVLQDETGAAHSAMSVDEIKLIAAGAGLWTPVPSTPSATPPATGTPRPTATPAATVAPTKSPTASRTPSPTASQTPSPTPRATASPTPSAPTSGSYPWHTGIVSTTFWVGEIFDASLPDGSQVFSTYDAQWEAHYGGCDGSMASGSCQTEARTIANGYFPSAIAPRENPFYLDLPYDDINDPIGFASRDSVIPWAAVQPYASHRGDSNFSYMKNRWVQLTGPNGNTCYAQIEDAGPSSGSLYHDAVYVFGSTNARPANKQFNGAGMDVSPALNGCLGFSDLNGDNDRVSWRFLDDKDVPAGPWRRIVTTSLDTP